MTTLEIPSILYYVGAVALGLNIKIVFDWLKNRKGNPNSGITNKDIYNKLSTIAEGIVKTNTLLEDLIKK